MNSGSPDYFNTCATTVSYASVPDNSFGHQPPRHGNGYVGIIAWEGEVQSAGIVNRWGEYMQTKLLQPLKAGKRYCVSFYVSNAVANAAYNFVGIDRIAANFSTTQPIQSTGLTMQLPQHISNPAGRYLTDTTGWTKITGIYTATGGEEWLTIGWFDNNKVPGFNPVLPSSPTDNYRCYLYLDDVTVVELDNTNTVVNVHDTTFCNKSTLPLTLQSSGQLGEYNWSNGAMSDAITVNDTGVFWCVSDAQCKTFIDTYRIHYEPQEKLNLGKTLINCKNEPITIRSNIDSSSYLWSNGSTLDSITVNTTGVYTLTINNKCGIQKDSVHVYIQPPTPAPTPSDTIICQFIQDPVLNVKGNDLLWYTHSAGIIGSPIQPRIITREPGLYNLYVTQTQGKCESEKAHIAVDVRYTPHDILGDRVTMCENDIQVIGKNIPGVEYKWNTGELGCCVTADREGTYRLAMTNECGTYIDTLIVYHTPCDECIAMPNAFTPFTDYNNRVLRPLIKCPVSEFEIHVYNRWGNEVYASTDVYEGWNGRYRLEWAPAGVYVYIIKFRAKDKPQFQTMTGNVTLLR